MYQMYKTVIYNPRRAPAVMTKQYSQCQVGIWFDRTARGLSSMAEPR